VLKFLRGREDAVLFGSQAVNAYVGEPRMSQGIDLVSTRAVELAEELRKPPDLIAQKVISYHARRVRVISDGKGYRLQIQKPYNRHAVMETWRALVAQELIETDEEGEFE
jgi:hypothetical protein